MSNIKKTIPTLVGGAMLLSNVTALAVNEVINPDAQNQEIENESNGTSGDVVDNIIEVEGDEVVKDENNVEKEEGTKDEVKEEVKVPESKPSEGAPEVNQPVVETPVVETPVVETPVAETPVVETPVIENQPNTQVTQEQLVNLLNNARAVSNQKVMQVNKDAVVVREGSAINSSQVGTLKKSDYVDVYEQNTLEGWSKINFEGKMAYVNTADLVDVEKINKEAVEDGVVVRSGAGTSYGEFGKLAKGERVQVYQELSNGWSKINYNGKIAFVEAGKLKETYTSKATVTVEKVNVYETASATGKVLGEAKKGEVVLIYGEEGEYYKVKFGESFGYIKKTDLKVIENIDKPQTGDAMVFSYMGTFGVSVLGLVSVNRKKKN